MNTTQDWLEIKLETTEEYDSERLEEALFAAGALSVTLTSKADEVILIEPTPGELPLWEQGIIVTGLFEQGFDADEAFPIIKACLATETLPLIGSKNLVDRTWELEWTKYFHPIKFGQNLWICPSNKALPADELNDNTQIITLDPGLAFGTGTHPTTAMALEYIANQDITGLNVIDFGCGSGVLGIAALKMQARSVIMTDIDSQALKTTMENAKINHVDKNINCYLPEEVPKVKTDFLIANILLEPLLHLQETFVALCHPKTVILLTGLLNEQVEQIINHYRKDFEHFSVTSKGDWSMVTAVKNQSRLR